MKAEYENGKEAEIALASMSTRIPRLSYIHPKKRAAKASTSIAAAYRSGSVSLGTSDSRAICIVISGKSAKPSARRLIPAMYRINDGCKRSLSSASFETSKFSDWEIFFWQGKEKATSEPPGRQVRQSKSYTHESRPFPFSKAK